MGRKIAYGPNFPTNTCKIEAIKEAQQDLAAHSSLKVESNEGKYGGSPCFITALPEWGRYHDVGVTET